MCVSLKKNAFDGKNMNNFLHYFTYFSIIILLSSIALFFVYVEAEGACKYTCKKRLARQAADEEAAKTTKGEKALAKDPITANVTQTLTDEELKKIKQESMGFIQKVHETPEEFAEWDKTYISIIISKSCELSSSCTDYKHLADTYDNSLPEISGDFSNSTGEYKREQSNYYRPFDYYHWSNYQLLLFVDPDELTRSNSKTIIIEPKFYEYPKKATNMINVYDVATSRYVQQRQVIEDYWIDDSCKNALIGWNPNGPKILSSIVQHFYNQCDNPMPINNTKYILKPLSEIIYCGIDCQHKKFVAAALNDSKRYMINEGY